MAWQQSGSRGHLSFVDTDQYISDLNKQHYAGFDDWRLPILEEAMSLMEAPKKKNYLYVDLLFDKWQSYIWTSDKYGSGAAWSVGFNVGRGDYSNLLEPYVCFIRAVRTIDDVK